MEGFARSLNVIRRDGVLASKALETELFVPALSTDGQVVVGLEAAFDHRFAAALAHKALRMPATSHSLGTRETYFTATASTVFAFAHFCSIWSGSSARRS